ncbi:hypothetical protein F0262_04555 [Vibrio rotiferianus]|uniref:Uncharacterized protein n=1 Tax=Vibrio rotiferianus TaxID=190895 RepID=A0A7Y3Z6D2_9VIBR|nr:hypothetical protein [Vibrio rotiferianus]
MSKFSAKSACIDSNKRSFSGILKFFCFFIYFITISLPNELFFKKTYFFPQEIRNSAVNKSNFERTTWFSETSETATSENQLEKSPWQ